jgi:carboxyl-terminal processing protease
MVVLREGVKTPLTFELTRENVHVKSISYTGVLDHDIGYIKLDRFGTNAGEEMRAAITELKSHGRLGGLVLDLRGNPGGLLESAVDVASKFVPSGSVIVTTRGRDSSEERTYRSIEEPIASGIPLVVMVDGGTASAAEIVAGAIQDLDGGIILGEQSFGKGLVQSVRRLPHDATLKMTTARYFTPSGRCIQKIDYRDGRFGLHVSGDTAHSIYHTRTGRMVYEHGGITPDTLVSEDTLSLVEQLRRNDLLFNFATRYAAGMKSIPASFSVNGDLFHKFEDYALGAMAGSTASGSALSELRVLEDAARREGFSSGAIQRIASLKAGLMEEEEQSFERNREAISRALYCEIAGRFGGQRERVGLTIPGDHQIDAALGLLRAGRGEYTRLLSVR